MVILGGNKGDSNLDTRDLIFATQSLVKKLKRATSDKTDKELSSTNVHDLISAGSFVGKAKDENSFYQHRYSNDKNDHGWMLQTRLHKRKVKKTLRQFLLSYNKSVH